MYTPVNFTPTSKVINLTCLYLKKSIDKTKNLIVGTSDHSVPSSRIIGGKDVPLHGMPWQAGVALKTGRLKDDVLVFCGGTIICPRFVISAAHCQVCDGKLLDKSDVVILTGATRLPPEGHFKRH